MSRAGATRPRPRARLKSYRSSDGFLILVGKDAASNDVLSLAIASPEDFWLHVAGWEGSHVIVKNPDGLTELPRACLREAAALAAHHSKARTAGTVAVHHTQARHVGKRRGMAVGMVELSRWSAVRVRPEIPTGVVDVAS